MTGVYKREWQPRQKETPNKNTKMGRLLIYFRSEKTFHSKVHFEKHQRIVELKIEKKMYRVSKGVDVWLGSILLVP